MGVQEPRAPVTAVIFDYGQVLCVPQPPDGLREIEAAAGLGGEAFWEPYWGLREAYDRDDLGSVEYWREVGRRAGVTFDDDQIQRLVEADHRSWSHLNEPMVAWAGRLNAAAVRVGLLSNAPRDFGAYVRRTFAWASGFGWLTFSGELGIIKPDPAIYHHCLDGLGVRDPGEALFLDDREVNVEGARTVGMRALQFTSVEALAADLASLDGLPPPRT